MFISSQKALVDIYIKSLYDSLIPMAINKCNLLKIYKQRFLNKSFIIDDHLYNLDAFFNYHNIMVIIRWS